MQSDYKTPPNQGTRSKRTFVYISTGTETTILPSEKQQEKILRSCYEDSIEHISMSYYDMLLTNEKKSVPEPNYLSAFSQKAKDVVYLAIDWIHEVCLEFKYGFEISFLAGTIMRMFFQATTSEIEPTNIQMHAIVSLMLASKYETTRKPLTFFNMRYLCGSTYTKQQLTECEQKMLAALKYELNYITPSHFFSYYTDNDLNISLAECLVAIAVRDERYTPYLSSQIAETAIRITHHILQQKRFAFPMTNCQMCFIDLLKSGLEKSFFSKMEHQQVVDCFKLCNLDDLKKYLALYQ